MRHPWYIDYKSLMEWRRLNLLWNTEYIMRKYKVVRKTARMN